jgi:Tol biopolymer transport system component
MVRTPLAVPVAVAFLCGTIVQAQEKHPVTQLTVDAAQEGFPAWSPDGATIVYSLGSRESPEMTGLWKVRAEGGEPSQLTDIIGEHPDWSPDGRHIVFDADSGNAIKMIPSEGGKPTRVVPESIPVFRGGNPNWSPDGSRIAFREGSNLWVLDVGTGKATVAFGREGTYPIPGCWSRDGEEVYMTVRDIESYESEIWRVSSSGAEPLRLEFETERRLRYMDLSPDGTLLAFTACKERDCDLWVARASGGKPVQLTFHPAYDDTPRWSPDGTRIAFTSTRSGSFDVWVMDVDAERVTAALESAQ